MPQTSGDAYSYALHSTCIQPNNGEKASMLNVLSASMTASGSTDPSFRLPSKHIHLEALEH